MTTPERPERDERHLLELLSNVQQARTRVRDGRERIASSASHHAQAVLRAELLGALEVYAEAAAAAGVPLPYRYRDEMSLYRSLLQGPPRTLGHD